MNLCQYIKELLFKSNYVIIPDFGGFILNYCDTKINKNLNSIIPPEGSLIFNSQLVHHDGLLTNFLIKKLNIKYNEAESIIKEYSAELNYTLYKNKIVKLEGLGEIKISKENSLEFTPDKHKLVFPYTYGLSSFIAYPAKNILISKEIQKNIIRKSDRFKTTKVYKLSKWAAAAAIIIIFSVLISNRLNNYNNTIIYSDLFSFIGSKIYNSHLQKPEISTNNITKTDSNIINEENLSSKYPRNVEEPFFNNKNLTSTPINTKSDNQYYIISGCFSIEEHAKTLVNELISKGFNSFICGRNKNNLLRVTYGLYPSFNIATAELEKIKKSDNPSAWILKK